MTPKRLKIYHAPAYPDRLSLAQATLRDHQPRGWLRPAMAAAVMAAMGAGMMGCPKKPITQTEPTTEQPGGTVAPGNTMAPGSTVAPGTTVVTGDTSYPPLPGIPVPPSPPSEEQVTPPAPIIGCTVGEPKQ